MVGTLVMVVISRRHCVGDGREWMVGTVVMVVDIVWEMGESGW